MVLIVEAGGTKTDWLLSDYSISTGGINPFLMNHDSIQKILDSANFGEKENLIEEIYFFGAGLSSSENRDTIYHGLKKRFPEVQKIHVKSDMEAAVLAFGNQGPCHIGILGTGSNSIFFDGEQMLQIYPSLGYVLGDEGSGAQLGKYIINAFAHGLLGKHLEDLFEKEFDTDIEQIKEKLYGHSTPSSFLASFAPFALKYVAHPVLQELITTNFRAFFEKRILSIEDYSNYPLHLTGGIAYHFKEILMDLAENYGIQIGYIIERPGHLLQRAIRTLQND